MKSFTKYLQFSKETREIIHLRDNERCIFCDMEYQMPINRNQNLGLCIKTTMHYIDKSHLGLGIEANGITACQYHHNLNDNGNKGLENEMKEIMKLRLQTLYENWNEEELFYKKYNNYSIKKGIVITEYEF